MPTFRRAEGTSTSPGPGPVLRQVHPDPHRAGEVLAPESGVPTFYSVKQIAARHPALSERTLRYWIHFSIERVYWKGRQRLLKPGNGFAKVIVRKGGRIFIDEAALIAWLREGNTGALGE